MHLLLQVTNCSNYSELILHKISYYNASTPVIDVHRSNVSSCCLSTCPILVKGIFKEDLGLQIARNTNSKTNLDQILLVKGHCDLTNHVSSKVCT